MTSAPAVNKHQSASSRSTIPTAAPTRSLPERILAGKRIFLDFFNVLDRNQSRQMIIFIDDEKFFDSVFVQQFLGVLQEIYATRIP